MKTKSVPSLYRYCMSRLSTLAVSTFTPALNVRSTTFPVSTFLSLVRTKAPPLPGLTCWNSTTVQSWPSKFSTSPFFRSLVVATVGLPARWGRSGGAERLAGMPAPGGGSRVPAEALDGHHDRDRRWVAEQQDPADGGPFQHADPGPAAQHGLCARADRPARKGRAARRDLDRRAGTDRRHREPAARLPTGDRDRGGRQGPRPVPGAAAEPGKLGAVRDRHPGFADLGGGDRGARPGAAGRRPRLVGLSQAGRDTPGAGRR